MDKRTSLVYTHAMNLPPQFAQALKKKPRIATTATRHAEMSADGADIWVTIKGSTLVTGNAALRKAKEVNQLVTGLLDVGITEADLSLQGIEVESSSGVLSRSTSASYSLRIRCSDLELLASILGAISAQKVVILDRLDWRYPDDKEARLQLLEECVAEAKAKAVRIAAALGVKLGNVRGFTETWTDPEQTSQRLVAGSAMPATARRAREVDLGFQLSHTKSVELGVEIEYAIDRQPPGTP